MQNGLRQIGRSIALILAAIPQVALAAVPLKRVANGDAVGTLPAKKLEARTVVGSMPAFLPESPASQPRLEPVVVQPLGRRQSALALADAPPGPAYEARCGAEGVALATFARSHLARKTVFEVSVCSGVPQLWAVLRVVARSPRVGVTCTPAQAQVARLGSVQVGDELRIRVYVADAEYALCRRQDRQVACLLGFSGAVQKFRALRRAAYARTDSQRRQALPPPTVRIGLAEGVRVAARAPNAGRVGIAARKKREHEIACAGSDAFRRLFATFRHRGMMRHANGERRVSPSATTWVRGTARLRFLGPALQDRDATKVCG